jgi:hypothetical protein
MKRIRVIVAAAVFAACIGFGSVLAMLPPDDRPGVTKANFDRIALGSERDDVERILGGPGRMMKLYRAGAGVWCNDRWSADDGSCADIGFFNDKVTGTRWTDSTETASQKLCRWSRWPWW